jgi:sugar lactone lactonase YvrE
MFWTDWGSEPKIERAGMDGSHRQIIVSYEVKWPNGLTLDLVRKRVYWVDAKLNVISSCNYDGSKRRVILYSPDALQHPFSITTFEDWVYWTDWDKQAVYRANKFNGKDITPITATHMVSGHIVLIKSFVPLIVMILKNQDSTHPIIPYCLCHVTIIDVSFIFI